MKPIFKIVLFLSAAASLPAWADPDKNEAGPYYEGPPSWTHSFESEREARKRYEEWAREAQKHRQESRRERRKHYEEMERERRKHYEELQRERRKYYEELQRESHQHSLEMEWATAPYVLAGIREYQDT